MTLAEMREQINQLGVQMSGILAKAREENRALSPEEETQFDKIDADREKLLKQETRQAKVEELDSTQGRRSAPSNPDQNQTRRQTADPTDKRRLEADRLEGFRSWFQAGSDKPLTAEQRAAAQRAGVNVNNKRLRITLPSVALRSLHRDDIKEWESRAQSVNADGSPGGGGEEGGFLVQNEAMRELEIALASFGGMRQVATVWRTATGAELPVPTTNDTNNEGAILAENAEHTELPIHFQQLVLNSYKYTSRLILVSVELMQDSAFDFASLVGRLLGERLGRITNRHFTVGTGTSQPNGIVTAATLGVTSSLGAAVSYNDVVDLEHSVDPAYRTGARWMFHDSVLKVLKKLKVPQFSGDTAGMPMWQSGMAVGSPDTILGYPYTINQHMAEIGPTSPSADKSMLFGQLSKYIIRDVRDITLVRLDERYAEFGQVAFLAFSRHDGDLLDAGTNPVKYLLNA